MRTWGLSSVIAIGLFLFTASACDSGSGLSSGTALTPSEPEPTEPEPTEPTEPEPTGPEVRVDDTVFETETELTPVAPTRRPLPSGLTEGATLVVARSALAGRFLFGVGADPDGVVGQIGGGAAGIAPIRAVIELVPDAPPAPDDASADGETAADPALPAGGTLEIRVWSRSTGGAVPGDDGLIESYAYVDLDAETIRVDFSQPKTALEIALYGSCRYTQSAFELEQPPLYADGLLTWPAREVYQRSGQCQWVPRSATGVHVHYLRHDLAGRDFVPRTLDADQPFGFFLAGDERAPLLARLPGIAPDEPARTHTYYLVDFPKEYVAAAEETFESWNDALEEVTGRRPFAVAPAPDDLIPWDPRHHAVVWDTSDSGVGAVAPFTEDPETGEIFQSLVVMWFGNLPEMHESYADFFAEHPDVADAIAPPLPADPDAAAFGAPPDLPAFSGIDRKAAIARAVRPPDLPARTLSTRPFVPRAYALADVPPELLRELDPDELSYIITVDFLLHEVGHNLGLRHNFIASADKHLHAPTHVATSTMDYVIGQIDPGSYDRDAMAYGYGDAPAKHTAYLFCTDETLDLDPACIPWDYGHPIRYQLALIGAYFAAYPPESDARDVERALRDLDAELNRARRFVNTDYEKWDESEVLTFDELVAMVDCQKDCTTHPLMRSALSLYLLYTRHLVTAWWEPGYPDIWMDFPTLSETQAALLMDRYFELVTRRDEPLTLKTTIIEKLPTSAVSGAVELLARLYEHYQGLSALSGDEAEVKAAVDAAYASL